MNDAQRSIEQLAVDTIRMLSIDMIEQAVSGHPGMPLGMSPAAYVLWRKVLRHNPKNPNWFNRDRFILSAGHGSALLYALLHVFGYDVSLDDLKEFRQWGSKTPGHPEYGETPGVESTSGPLGQGFAAGVGMALAERYLASLVNKPDYSLIDHYTYAIVSDGDLMEGISSEAASLAGFLKLGKLIYIYDDNNISIDGNTDITFTEDVTQRFKAYHWQVVQVDDGNDLDAIEKAIDAAKENTDQPSLVIVKTHIGYGSPKQDTPAVHGAALGTDALSKTKQFYNWPEDPAFYVPEEVYSHFRNDLARLEQMETAWNKLYASFKKDHKKDAALMHDLINSALPVGWDTDIPAFAPGGKDMATRQASGTVMEILAQRLPTFIGGSADLGSSVKTILKKFGAICCDENGSVTGRNIYYGVREHAMGAITNGLALHGGIIPFASTFFVFSDYMRPSIRMAAIMNIHSIFVFSHDSIGVGEDGPTHQPIEHLMSLRAMPNLTVLRPADANETIGAWNYAIAAKKPVCIILSRQNLPVIDPAVASVENVAKGAYIVSDSKGTPDIILIATGSEVQHIVAAKKVLDKDGVNVRVVSMPSWKLFAAQDAAYRESVLPASVKTRLAIEAGATMGWERWVGAEGAVIGIDHFGSSAPGDVLMDKFGFSTDNVVKRVRALLKK